MDARNLCNARARRMLLTCLYGCENWILTAPLLEPLECFQAEIANRILMLPPYHNNLGARAVISWPSMKLRILLRKLRFLTRLSSPDNSSISATIFRSLRNQNPGPLIVQQCLFLEQEFGTSCTSDILSAESPHSMIIKKQLSNADSILLWDKLKDRNHLRHLHKTSLWPKLWNNACDHGIPGSKSIRAIVKPLTRPLLENTYPHCKENILANVTYAQHTMVHHLGHDISLLDAATKFDDDLSNFSKLIELGNYYKQFLFTADIGT